MHPANHEAALSAFFRRNDFHLPPGTDATLVSMGCALAAARLLRENAFHIGVVGGSGRNSIGTTVFEPDERPLIGLATYIADRQEDMEAGRAPDHNGAMIDRMALLLRRAARAGVNADADYLAAEGIPSHLIIEFGLEAAQLAEAMALAEHAYTTHRKAREAVGAALESEAA